MEEAMQAVAQKVAAINARDVDALRSVLSPDIEWEEPSASLRGKEQVARFMHTMWEAFPDARLDERQVAAGSVVAGEGTLTGTHVGTLRSPGGDIPPAGKRLEIRYAAFYEVKQGKIAKMRVYYDLLDFLTQLGVAPTPAHI